MIEDADYATTTYDRLPRVRLSDDRRSAMCFDADCGTVFARDQVDLAPAPTHEVTTR